MNAEPPQPDECDEWNATPTAYLDSKELQLVDEPKTAEGVTA